MRESLVVFRRELKSYFLSPIAYVFGLLLVSVLLWYSTEASLVNGARASTDALFSTLPFMLILFVPGLTMRLWAEERKLGTLELLMTFPVTIGQLVIGKFLAAVVFLGLVLVLTLGLPLTLGAYGKLDWPPVLGSYLASLLFAGAFVAVGMFWSSLTRDQIIAMLLSLVSLFTLYQLGNPVNIELGHRRRVDACLGDRLGQRHQSVQVLPQHRARRHRHARHRLLRLLLRVLPLRQRAGAAGPAAEGLIPCRPSTDDSPPRCTNVVPRSRWRCTCCCCWSCSARSSTWHRATARAST